MNTGDTIWRGHFYADRCTLNDFIMTAYAPRLCCFSASLHIPCSDPAGDFGQNDNTATRQSLFSTFYIFFVISKLIDRLSKKYVSYLSDVSPARSSHANRAEDSLSLSHVRASMQNALISLPMYRPTGWKCYLGSVPRWMRAVLYRELIYLACVGKYRVHLLNGTPNITSKDNYGSCNYGWQLRPSECR